MTAPVKDPLLFNTILLIHDTKEAITKEELEEHFSQFGHVINVNMKEKPEKSCYYTFIKFTKTSEACRALDQMKGQRMPGLSRFTILLADFNREFLELDVDFQDMLHTLYISYPKDTYTKEMIAEHFEKYGDLESVNLLKHKNSNRLQGVAFVKFVRQSDAALALEEMKPPFKAKWAKVRVIPTAHIDEVRMMKHQEKYGPHSEMPMMDVGRGMIGNGHQKMPSGGYYGLRMSTPVQPLQCLRGFPITSLEANILFNQTLKTPGMMGLMDKEFGGPGFGGFGDGFGGPGRQMPGRMEVDGFGSGNMGRGKRGAAMNSQQNPGMGGGMMNQRNPGMGGEMMNQKNPGMGGGMMNQKNPGMGGEMMSWENQGMGGGMMNQKSSGMGGGMMKQGNEGNTAIDADDGLADKPTTLEVLVPQSISLDNLRRIFDICPGLLSFDVPPGSRMARLVYKSQALAAHAKEKADGLDWCGEFIAVRYPPEKSVKEKLEDTLKQLKSGNAITNFTSIVSSLEDAITSAVSQEPAGPSVPLGLQSPQGLQGPPSLQGLQGPQGMTEQRERVPWCDVPLPYPKPMASPDAKYRAEIFIRAKDRAELFPDEILCQVLSRFGGLVKAFWVKAIEKKEAFARFNNVPCAVDCFNTINGASIYNVQLKCMWAKNSKYQGEKITESDEQPVTKKTKFN